MRKDDQMIYLKDLLFAALYQWRRILAVSIVLAMLLGGLGAASAWKDYSENNLVEPLPEEIAAYEAEKLRLEELLADTQENIQNQEKYLKESELMALNPYQYYRASMNFIVDADYQIMPGMQYQNPDPTASVLWAYRTILDSGYAIDVVAESVGMEGKYLKELVHYTEDADTGSLSLSVRYSTVKGAQKLLELLVAQLKAIKPQIDETIGKHEIRLVTSYVTECADLDLLDTQEAAENYLEELQVTLEDTQTALDELVAPTTQTVMTKADVVKKAVIYAVVGAVLGIFVVSAVAWVSHVGSGKIYSARTLQNWTGIKVLGCVPASESKNAIDRRLKMLEGRSIGEEQIAVTAANVRNYCAGATSLLVAGDCDVRNRDLVSEVLKKAGVEAAACGDLLHSAEALQALPGCDGVLLVEKCGCSRYADVLQTMELVADQGKPIVGCVLLDG